MPTHGKHGTHIDEDEDGIFNHHVERGGDTAVYLAHIGADTCQNVALALFGEEGERQGKYLLVDVVADVADNACTQGHQEG